MSNWTLLVPVYNLRISSDINREIQIGRILFVDTGKLPYIRKRLGIRNTIAELMNEKPVLFDDGRTLKETEVIAAIRTTWDGKRKFLKEYAELQDAINLLASSQMIYMKRSQFTSFGGPKTIAMQLKRYKIVENAKSKRIKTGWHRITPIQTFELDALWRVRTKTSFFQPVLRIYNIAGGISRKWAESLTRAGMLIGKSVLAETLWEAFLYNFVALEILLAQKGDKFPEVLIDRVSALLGWITDDRTDQFTEEITEIYRKRCDLFHDGFFREIEINDVLRVDHYVYNIYHNLARTLTVFPNKKTLIDFTTRYKAYRILERKVPRPKQLQFLNRRYSEHDLTRLNEKYLLHTY